MILLLNIFYLEILKQIKIFELLPLNTSPENILFKIRETCSKLVHISSSHINVSDVMDNGPIGEQAQTIIIPLALLNQTQMML